VAVDQPAAVERVNRVARRVVHPVIHYHRGGIPWRGPERIVTGPRVLADGASRAQQADSKGNGSRWESKRPIEQSRQRPRAASRPWRFATAWRSLVGLVGVGVGSTRVQVFTDDS
jgi:hypothetical protein